MQLFLLVRLGHALKYVCVWLYLHTYVRVCLHVSWWDSFHKPSDSKRFFSDYLQLKINKQMSTHQQPYTNRLSFPPIKNQVLACFYFIPSDLYDLLTLVNPLKVLLKI